MSSRELQRQRSRENQPRGQAITLTKGDEVSILDPGLGLW